MFVFLASSQGNFSRFLGSTEPRGEVIERLEDIPIIAQTCKMPKCFECLKVAARVDLVNFRCLGTAFFHSSGNKNLRCDSVLKFFAFPFLIPADDGSRRHTDMLLKVMSFVFLLY